VFVYYSYLRQNILALSTRDTLYTHPSLNSSYALSDSILSLQKAMDKSLLMLVQTACKSDKLPRALDAARMLNLPKSIESAVQIAGFYHLPGLKEKLERLREKKEEEVRREEDEEEERLSRGRRERAAAASRYSIPAPKISYAFDPTASAPASYGGASSTSRAVQDFAPRPTGAKRTFSTIPPKSSAPSSSSRFTISSSVDPESSYNDTSDTPMGEIETDPTDVAMENGMSDGEDGEGSSSSMTMGGKRKRGEDDRMAEPFAPVAAKKRGLNGESSEGSMGPPPKPARKSFSRHSLRLHCLTALSTSQPPRTHSPRSLTHPHLLASPVSSSSLLKR
jgi:chromosome transmission fidelity protein 4